MALAVSFRAYRWAAWAWGTTTSEAPARAVFEAHPEFQHLGRRPFGTNQRHGRSHVKHTPDNLTQESNAGQSGAFLCRSSGSWRDVTTVYTRSAFDRLPARIGDADTGYRDLALAHSHDLTARRGEPIAH
jgi:hypothetical protein